MHILLNKSLKIKFLSKKIRSTASSILIVDKKQKQKKKKKNSFFLNQTVLF